MRPLLAANVSVDQARNSGATPLSITCEVGHAECTLELLRMGAGLHCRLQGTVSAPSPLELARQHPTGSAAAQLIIRAAEPWSHVTHYLFPVPARSHAVELLRLGYLLAFREYPMQFGSLTDVWRKVVMPFAVER